MNIQLLVHNIGYGISAIATVGTALFILFNTRRTQANTIMVLAVLSIAVFIISHIIGVNIVDPVISKNVLMFNLSMCFIGIFSVHAILAYLGKVRSRTISLIAVYVTGIFLFIWFIIYPDLFLLPSVPKMYFANYYNPGVLNWIRVIFLYVVCLPYICIEILLSRRATIDLREKQQLKFLFLAIVMATIFGFIPNLLVYNIMIDPSWGMVFMVIFALIFIYGSLRYELFNIKIIAKQAFVYTAIVGVIGGLIALLDYGNRLIQTNYPTFPIWISPLISAFFVVILASFIWRRLRENEILKYEFVTTVAHKFRTPLTHIKWASENLTSKLTSDEDKNQLAYIKSADEKLVELTTLLMNISEVDNNNYDYKMVRNSISKIVEDIADSHKEQYTIKGLRVVKDIEPNLFTDFDESRIKFVVQTFTENAMHYTPEGGQIDISLEQTGKDITFSVKDSGMGISNIELPRLFNKFYRGHNARLADTEGMGIGLYMSKEIIARHGGRIWAYSQGSGKGSIFSFSLKAK